MKREFKKRLLHKDVRITKGFWKQQMDKIQSVTTRDVLDKFEHDHEEGIMKNYEWVIQGEKGKHIGPPWYDGLICEVIRGISDMIAVTYDEYLDQKIEYYTEKISAAQETDPEGYINTYTTLICPEKRWGENGGSLIWQHELYNIGCLVEAGVHYYLATGKTKLLSCSIKAADCMCNVMGPEPLKNIVPAHSLPEEAMVKLYHILKDDEALRQGLAEEYNLTIQPEKYLDLVCFWMDHRGVHHNRASFPHYMGEYAQDHCRIEEQSEAVGHAVRAALMYTGLTAVGMEAKDSKYLDAAKRIWDNVVLTKLHVSGGIGAVHNEERFGFQYDLPNDAYLETCAGVALAFWAGEMFLAFGESSYMDVFESALYNNVLPGLSVDGQHYFYENPLISVGSIERWDWHGCPCCPPMFLKLMGSLQDYIYAYSRDEIVINLHMGSRGEFVIGDQNVTIEQKNCGIPYSGNNQVVVHLEQPKSFKLSIRRPAWSERIRVEINGETYEQWDERGYITLDREWHDGAEVLITLDVSPMKVEAHPYVSADVGKIAIFRGPLLYCVEEIDHPNVMDMVLDKDDLEEDLIVICDMKAVSLKGKTNIGDAFTAVPYYLWNNRGKGKMNVWIHQVKDGDEMKQETSSEVDQFAAHQTGAFSVKQDMADWEGKLYRRFKN